MSGNSKNQVVHYNRMLPYFSREEETDDLSNAFINQAPELVGRLLDNLNNLSKVVVFYKRKLRRQDARNLVGEMHEDIDQADNIDESFTGGGEVILEDGVEALQVDFIMVTEEEWGALVVKASELHITLILLFSAYILHTTTN
jgi:hypothetical protein